MGWGDRPTIQEQAKLQAATGAGCLGCTQALGGGAYRLGRGHAERHCRSGHLVAQRAEAREHRVKGGPAVQAVQARACGRVLPQLCVSHISRNGANNTACKHTGCPLLRLNQPPPPLSFSLLGPPWQYCQTALIQPINHADFPPSARAVMQPSAHAAMCLIRHPPPLRGTVRHHAPRWPHAPLACIGQPALLSQLNKRGGRKGREGGPKLLLRDRVA